MPTLDPHVHRTKYEAEISSFLDARHLTIERGCRLALIQFPVVWVEFTKMLPVMGINLPLVMQMVELDYSDFDLQPPSLTFLDPVSGAPGNPLFPFVQHLPDGSARNLVVQNELLGRPFLCHPGIREYHSHPEHEGDDWLIYREQGYGGLLWLVDLLWSTGVATVHSLQFALQANTGPPQAPRDAAANS